MSPKSRNESQSTFTATETRYDASYLAIYFFLNFFLRQLTDPPSDSDAPYRRRALSGHFRFLDFEGFPGQANPIWLTQVRDPADKYISM